MFISDQIADMLTRIRNAVMVRHDFVDVPASKLKIAVLKILKEEGFIKGYTLLEQDKITYLKVELLYSGKKKAITEITKISKPGGRVYVDKDNIPDIKNGIGTVVLSTSKGVLSNKKAREFNVGGELLFYFCV